MHYQNENINIRDISKMTPQRDIMNVNDIKGTKPELGKYFRERNVDKDGIIGEQIKHQPEHKSRHEQYGYQIRNPLFHDFYYKDYQKSPPKLPVTSAAGYSENNLLKQNKQFVDYSNIQPYPKQINMYGSNIQTPQQIPNFSKENYQKQQQTPGSNQNLGSIYDTKPLRYDIKPLRDHGYPYPKSPVDLRMPISTPSHIQNIMTPQQGLKQQQSQPNIFSPNYNKPLSQGNMELKPHNYQSGRFTSSNNQNNQLISGDNSIKNQQNQRTQSQPNINYKQMGQQNNQYNNNNNMIDNIKESKSQVYDNQQQNYYNQQQSYQKDFQNAFQQERKLPDIRSDIRAAEKKTQQQNEPVSKEQQQSRNNQNNFSEIYNENYGYKNVKNRYTNVYDSYVIPRSNYLSQDVTKIAGSLYENPYKQNSSQLNQANNTIRNKSSHFDAYSSKQWKPLNIISGKRHQQYVTTLDQPAWDWKLYDREQFNKWDGNKSHIKNIIKDKNVRLDSKKAFSTANHEYGELKSGNI